MIHPRHRHAAALRLLALGPAACGGRDARHIPVVEPNDAALDCQALIALIAANNTRIQQLYDEHDRDRGANVAIGVVGALMFWPALIALDNSDTERVEARAMSDRKRYLASSGSRVAASAPPCRSRRHSNNPPRPTPP